MGLFDQVLNAINNPNQLGNTDQLGQILGVVQQLSSSQGTDNSLTQIATSVVGNYVRSALQDRRANFGDEQVEAIINQFSGTSANPEAVQAIFAPEQQEQMAQDIFQRTGLNMDTIQSMLPALVPIVLNFLQSGGSAGESPSGNSVLNAFLDTDRDGDVDIGDALSMASQFLNR